MSRDSSIGNAFGLVLYRILSVSALALPFVVINRKCVQLNSNSELLDGYKKSLVYSGSSRRVKTEEYKDHRLYRATPPAMDISTLTLSLFIFPLSY